MPTELDKEIEKRLIASIKQYFESNLDEDIGDLKARLLLDFCLQEIGPCIYNKAIIDAQSFMQEMVVDLDVSLYEPEFTYWTETSRSRQE